MKLWYYCKGEQKSGPVEQQELIELLKSGKLKPDTYVWSEGMEEWVMARTVEPLNAAAFGTPPPLPKSEKRVGSSGNVAAEFGNKVRSRFVAAFFQDEVPLYAGLKRVSVLIGIPIGTFLFLAFSDRRGEFEWGGLPSAAMALAFGFVAGRVPLWATREFREKPASSQTKKGAWSIYSAKASWVASLVIGLIALLFVVEEEGWDYPELYLPVAMLAWLGSLALFRCILWACTGFFGISTNRN